jgi:uncharacterized membrane-anchored protein YjiN (DUF445 family)
VTTTPAPAGDEEARSADLRRMKRRATYLLLAAAAVFVVAKATTDGSGWTGYVVAASEAAMIGGVADWFAVTALFRHPLRIPIPHTAIIPSRKDQIGRSLGDFVQRNFLDEEVVAERLRGFEMAGRGGAWMEQPHNAQRMAEQTSAAIQGVSEVLSDEDVASGLEHAILARLSTVSVAPVLGRVTDAAIEGGHHEVALEAVLRGLDRLLEENRPVLRQRLGEESPWWVPGAIDNRVFDKIMAGVHHLVADVLADPDHELRSHIEAHTRDLAARLQVDASLIERGEELKAELLEHREVRAWLNSLWSHVKEAVIAAADDPHSELRGRMQQAIERAGTQLQHDQALRTKVDSWLESVARYLIGQSRNEVADLIATTVQRWDADQTAQRIEVQVGRDLQFIRINGTVVGGLIGIVIHALGGLF